MKRSWRRALSLLLTVALMAGLLAIPAAAADPGQVGYIWDFTAAKEEVEPKVQAGTFDGLTLTNVKYHGTEYGTSMSNGSSIGVPVPGDCDIAVNVGYQWNLQLGDDASTLETNPDNGKTTVTFHYKGESGTATLKSVGNTYLAKIELKEYTAPAPVLELTQKDVVVRMGETATVTASVKNGTMGAVTAEAQGADVVEAAVEGGVITLTPKAPGTDTVTVTAAVTGGTADSATGTIAVRVLPAEVGVVTESTTYDFQNKNAEAYYAQGLEWNGLQLNNEHGPNQAGSMIIHLPEGKMADLTITTCGYGDGGDVTAGNGDTNFTVTSAQAETAEGGNYGKVLTVADAYGDVTVTFTKVYVHSLAVGAFTDTTLEFEAKKWEFANTTFDPATTYPELTITGGTATGETHGMAFFGAGSIVLPVNGPCDIVVTGSYAWDIDLNGSKLEHEKTPTEGQDPAELTFYYTGNAGTATLNCGARTWIKSIELKPATAAAEIPAKLAVETTSVSLKLGSSATSKAEVAVYLRNAVAGDVTAESDSEAVSVTYADGKLTIQGTAETETAATVSVKLKGEEAAAITVTVAGAAPADVKEGEYILTDTANPDRLNVPGIDWGKFVVVNNTHGAISEGETTIKLNLSAPADIQLITCPFGTGNHLEVEASSGTVSMEDINSCGGTDPGKGDIFGAKVSIVGAAKGQLSITLTPTEGGAGDTTFNVYDDVYLNYDEIWLKNLSVTYRADAGGDRNIDVWDLSGQTYAQDEFKFAGDKVVNNITPEIWVSSDALAQAQFAKAEATSFGDMDLTHNANDRIYSSVTGNAAFTALLGGNASSNYDQTFDDGFKSTGGYYANGTGSSANRCVTFKRMAAGDKIIAYVGSSQNGEVSIHFQGQGSAAGQEDISDPIEVKNYQRLEFVAEKEGSYKLWGGQPGGGKPFYIRFIRVPAVAVSGTITLPAEGFTATEYQVKFTNKTTKKATQATLGQDGTFTAALAAGYDYTAMLTGVSGFGFTTATKNVTTTNAEALTGKANVELVVEPKSTYTFSGKFTGFADGYDTSKLAVTLIPEEGSGSDEVDLEIGEGLSFSAKLDPGVTYTLAISGVNDYAIETPATVSSDQADVTRDIVMKAKDLHTASGKFAGLGADGKVTALAFENVEDKYTYTATVTDDGYTIKLRDGAYSAKATVEGTYSTITHVVVDGQDVEKDLMFVSTAEKPAVTKVKDVYVGYADKSPNFDTVTDAVDAISRMGIAAEADRVTVHIAPGTYREQITVKTPYITFINDEPDKGEVLLTWYYGIGYMYYSSNGYYDAQRAYDKYEKKIADRWGCAVRVTGKGFRAENITFENSFNRYITKEEIADGVEPSGTEAINLTRDDNTDVTTLAATERAAAICVEAEECEFYQCKFYSSQDTLYTQGKVYFKNCLIEGQTDYIFGDFASKCIFDACQLSWKGYKTDSKPGYVTAVRTEQGDVGYLFRNCTITANPKLTVVAGYFGRPWAAGASAKFVNTKLESAGLITAEAWASMNKDKPENAQFGEYNTTTLDGAAVDTTGRKENTVMTAEQAAEQTREKYFGTWTPYYYVEETDQSVALKGAPVITDNGDINVPKPGHTLTVSYTLTPDDAAANDASIIQWSRVADDGTETVVKTSTATVDKTYQIAKGDVGAAIKVTVTPATVSGKTGEAMSATTESKVQDGYEDPTGATDPDLGTGVNIFLAGDSTVKDYSVNGMWTNNVNQVEGSWGEWLQKFFNDKVTVANYAQGGRTTRSFIETDKSLEKIDAAMKEGDFLFIQFGHNDCYTKDNRYVPLGIAKNDPQKSYAEGGSYPDTVTLTSDLVSGGAVILPAGTHTTYTGYLKEYIKVTEKHGATAVLATPVSRMQYNTDGSIKPHHDAADFDGTNDNEYCKAVKWVYDWAKDQGYNVVFLDNYQLTADLFTKAHAACTEEDKKTYGQQLMSNATEGTHNNKLGGFLWAGLVAQAIQNSDMTIAKAVKAPSQVLGKTDKDQTAFLVDDQGKFTAYNMLKDYGETAPYWMGVGQELLDAIAAKAEELNPGPDVPDPDQPADVAALEKAIADAETEAGNTRVSEDGSDVSRNNVWVTEAEMTAFEEAIAAAKETAKKETVTEAEVQQALSDLAQAVKTFQAAQKDGTRANRPASSTSSGGVSTGTTSTQTMPDGSTVTTQKNRDGSQRVTTVTPEGQKTVTDTAANGDVTVTVTDADGQELAKVESPAQAPALGYTFEDVPEGHWAQDAIQEMAARKVVQGVSDTGHVFDMDSAITRGAMAQMLFNLSQGKTGAANPFADAQNSWYSDAVAWAAKAGVVTGVSDTNFAPEEPITREQLATMLYRYAKLLSLDVTATADLDRFVDADQVDSWANAAVAWSVGAGLFQGRGANDLAPDASASRAETAVVFQRFLELVK